MFLFPYPPPLLASIGEEGVVAKAILSLPVMLSSGLHLMRTIRKMMTVNPQCLPEETIATTKHLLPYISANADTLVHTLPFTNIKSGLPPEEMTVVSCPSII